MAKSTLKPKKEPCIIRQNRIAGPQYEVKIIETCMGMFHVHFSKIDGAEDVIPLEIYECETEESAIETANTIRCTLKHILLR